MIIHVNYQVQGIQVRPLKLTAVTDYKDLAESYKA